MLQMKEDETIDTFTTKLTTLVNKATSLGQTMEDETLVRKLLNAVPDRTRGMSQPSLSKIAKDEVEGTDDVPGLSVPRKSTRTVQSEIDFIMYNDTWELTDLPPRCKALGCKWIPKWKMKVDGSIDKYKARLVIQGFRQKEGINFFDTYALIARISTIRLLLALAAIHDLVIHQMDVKTTFLNGDLDEKIYMKQPEGFVTSKHESKINNMEVHLSTSGWVFLLGRDVISYTSKKQTCITSLTIEFELVALAAAGNEAEWLRNLVYEIPLWPKLIFTISIRCDSAATLAKAYS
nr:zinc finger, CCHC-type [Tanacetum cinerariifolium]